MLTKMAASPQQDSGPDDLADAAKRRQRIKAVGMLLGGILDGERIAIAFGVSRQTIYRWRNDLLADNQRDTDYLRRIPRKPK